MNALDSLVLILLLVFAIYAGWGLIINNTQYWHNKKHIYRKSYWCDNCRKENKGQ